MAVWAMLSWLYCWPAWLIGFFADRDLPVRASWRLAGATFLPGSLFMTIAIVLYGLGVLDLVRLGFAEAIHMVIGWVYLFISPFKVPRHPQVAASQANPFN
jgi:hypothetical protein